MCSCLVYTTRWLVRHILISLLLYVPKSKSLFVWSCSKYMWKSKIRNATFGAVTKMLIFMDLMTSILWQGSWELNRNCGSCCWSCCPTWRHLIWKKTAGIRRKNLQFSGYKTWGAGGTSRSSLDEILKEESACCRSSAKEGDWWRHRRSRNTWAQERIFVFLKISWQTNHPLWVWLKLLESQKLFFTPKLLCILPVRWFVWCLLLLLLCVSWRRLHSLHVTLDIYLLDDRSPPVKSGEGENNEVRRSRTDEEMERKKIKKENEKVAKRQTKASQETRSCRRRRAWGGGGGGGVLSINLKGVVVMCVVMMMMKMMTVAMMMIMLVRVLRLTQSVQRNLHQYQELQFDLRECRIYHPCLPIPVLVTQHLSGLSA